MTTRRAWRSFDYWLLAALIILSAYGAVMIYSATLGTQDLSRLPGRQLVYIVVGTALLFLVATLPYHLLEVLQHPLRWLVPLSLVVANAGLLMAWRAGQVPEAKPSLGGLLLANLPAMAVGAALAVVIALADKRWLEALDLPLLRGLLVALLLGAAAGGVWLVVRGPARTGSLTPYLFGAGLALLYLLDCLTLRATDMLRNPLYVLTLAMLGLTLLVGQVAGGAQSWLGAGAVQPSELAKVLVIVVLAAFFAGREPQGHKFSTLVLSLIVVALPMLLIYVQPDLGTALTLIPIWASMVWVAGVRLWHLVLLGAASVVALPAAWFGLHDYMRRRLLLFLDPSSDPDAYFNVHQALVSIGSGGWTGKGLTHGTQSQLHFLRVRHTDFIFAVTAEELGFLGAAAMIGLLFFIMWRMLRVADVARDTFGRLLVTGVMALIFVQTVVNVGMNLGLVPVTGLTLPFVSYGGSSYLTLMLGMGLVQSVAMRHKKLEFD